MDVVAVLEIIKTIGGALSTLLTVSAVTTLLIKPIREKFTKWIRKTSDSDNIDNKIDKLTELVEESIEQNNKLQEDMNTQSEALQASLRNSILNLYYKCKEKNSITDFELQNLSYLFDNYTKLKGNSFVKDCVSYLKGLERKDG